MAKNHKEHGFIYERAGNPRTGSTGRKRVNIPEAMEAKGHRRISGRVQVDAAAGLDGGAELGGRRRSSSVRGQRKKKQGGKRDAPRPYL